MNTATLPQDPALPQLAQALDECRMAPVFAGLLQGSGAALQRCRVDRIKYRVRRNLSVAYILELQDAQGPFTQRVAARMCSGGESARRHAQATAEPQQASRAGPALSHVAALDMALHWWPNDAKLAAGRLLADGAALQQHWLPAVARSLGAGPCVGHRVELAQLVPEQRVTARVDLHTADADGIAMRSVYAKADIDTRGPVTHQIMQSLWASAARRVGRLHLPQPLLWQPGSGLHWQAAVPGRALLDICPQPDAAREHAVGALVAALHATPAPAAPLQSADALRQRLKEVLAALVQVQPALQPRLLKMAALLEAGLVDAAAGAGPTAPGTLHGDLHPRNVLVNGDRLALIDLDNAHRGLPVLELGSWRAEALYRGQLDGHAWAAAEAAGTAFLAGYAQAGGDVPGPRQLAWATAWQLLCQRVWRCVVNLKPGRYALVPGLLALTEALLAQRELPVAALQEQVA